MFLRNAQWTVAYNVVMAQKFKLVHLIHIKCVLDGPIQTFYFYKHYFTNRGVVLKKRISDAAKSGNPFIVIL